ncbi:MAG: exodeoxyribonuclease VII large subunit [Pseudomonadota bacterium]|nr:exodeoxyribonuclease VII large subunit [Pseudomonadota bacterium]
MNLPEERSGLLAKETRGDNSPALTVGELAGSLKRMIEGAFGQVRVRGEISGFKRHSSGHCYFSLKDEAACIDAVIWRGQANALAFRPEDGAEIIATGKMTTYAGRSKYQLVIDRIELAGEGALMALLERRRKALAAEGLFDDSRKRSLPFFPRVIGVVTSPTGAVIRDILHRLEDRCPTHVIVWPVPVQGEGASAKIAAAIRGFGELDANGAIPRPDLLIVARGGGSIEDLWAFNEEDVVRAAAESPIPLISAVGHETDTTLIDHSSDRRAPTPTAAAEMAVPVRAELFAFIDEFGRRTMNCLSKMADRARERLELTVCRWPRSESLFAPMTQRLDEVGDRLPRALASRAGDSRADLNAVAPRLRPEILTDRLKRSSEKLESLWRLAVLAHPEGPLKRGFVRVTDRSGKTLAKTADAIAARLLTLRFGDGEVEAVTGSPAAPVERKRRSSYVAPQRGLFDETEI